MALKLEQLIESFITHEMINSIDGRRKTPLSKLLLTIMMVMMMKIRKLHYAPVNSNGPSSVENKV